jgi:hypothetical protein
VEAFWLIIPLVLGVAILFRVLAGSMDKSRIRDYIESRGGQVIDVIWTPFGPGWFGEKSDRIYEVQYIDGDGNEHRAACKTSLWTGVYFTQDDIVACAERPGERVVESLEDENRRLRAEVERLRRGHRTEGQDGIHPDRR